MAEKKPIVMYNGVLQEILSGDNIPTSLVKAVNQSVVAKSGFSTDPYRDWETDRKSTRLNSSHSAKSRMPSSA